MNGVATGRCRVQGTVAPGFESIRDRFEHDMNTMAEEHAQLCVYHRGERVVDLWASATGDPGFSADSLVNVFSSGKSLECIALASLVGQGLLRYDAKIAEHWPEFGANGKGALTVADLMRHEGGLAAFDTSMAPVDLLPEHIKANRVGDVIERHAARFPKGGSPREYHAVTRGWIANELFRRVDPDGRTIGEYLREEIGRPLDVDAIVGLPDSELGRVAPISPLGFGFVLRESLKPKRFGRRIVHNLLQILWRLLRALPFYWRSTAVRNPAPLEGMKGVEIFNEPIVRRGETPSANTHASARGLAKIAAMMSAGGRFDGREYVTPAAWEALHGEATLARLGFSHANFTQGGVNRFVETGPGHTRTERAFNLGREGFFGWMGLGGSIFQWHPEHEIGFGYVPTALHLVDVLNERGKVYQAEVLRCVAARGARAEAPVEGRRAAAAG